MPLDLEQLKTVITQKWHEFARNLAEATKRVGVSSAYGLLIAATFLPLLQAYTTNSTPAIIALTTIVSGVGSNLLAGFIQKVLDQRLTPAELENLAKQDPEIREVLDIILSKTDSIQTAQQALGDNWAVFSVQLKKEIQSLGNSPSSSAILNGKTIIKDTAVAAPITVIVQSGGQLIINGSFVQIHESTELTVYPSIAHLGEQ